MIYHFPCDVTFATQQTGFGSCPNRITVHVPLFTKQTFHYVPWTHHSKDILDLHYKSLNISPPLQFHNSTLQSLDRTFHLLDGQLATQLHTLKQDISKLHAVNETHTNDILTYVAFILALIIALRVKNLLCSAIATLVANEFNSISYGFDLFVCYDGRHFVSFELYIYFFFSAEYLLL